MKLSKTLRALGSGVLGLLLVGAVRCPAQAEFLQAVPEVSFSGVVEGINQQTIAVSTSTGVVLVPASESVFLANGVTTSPFSLPVGTPVVVAVPETVAPELTLADMGPAPYGLQAFPSSFPDYLVTSTAPPLYTPIPPQLVEAPVAYVPLAPPAYGPLPAPPVSYSQSYVAPSGAVTYQVAQQNGYASPATSYAPPAYPPSIQYMAPVDSFAAEPPPIPSYSYDYNAFSAPQWAPTYAANSYDYDEDENESQDNLSSYNPYGYGAFGYPAPAYAPSYPAYPSYAPYAAYPSYPGMSESVGLNVGGVQLGYNSWQPQYGYGIGFAPPPQFTPYGYGAFPAPYAPAVNSTDISLGGLNLSFTSLGGSPYPAYSPYGGYGYGMPAYNPYAYGNPYAAYGNPYAAYGAFPQPGYGYSGIGVNVGGIGVNFGSYNPQPTFGMYPMGGLLAPTSVTSVNFGGMAFNFVSQPTQPVFLTPFYGGGMPVYGATPFYNPVLGQAVGYQSNAVLVQTAGGMLALPVASLPGPVMAQMVYVRQPGGECVRVPFQTAMVMRNAGATIVSSPVIPNSALLSPVAVMRPSGQVVDVPMVAALHTNHGVILGTAGGAGSAPLTRVNPALFRQTSQQQSFGFVRPNGSPAAGAQTSALARPGLSNGPAGPHFHASGPGLRPGAPNAAAFHSAAPGGHAGPSAFHSTAAPGRPAFHGNSGRPAGTAFHATTASHLNHAGAPTAHFNHASAPAAHVNHASAPVAHFNHASTPVAHFNHATAPAAHFNHASAPTQHFNRAPAPAQHFNRAPAPAQHFNRAPAPAQHFNRAPAPAQHFNPAPAQHFNRAPAPAPHFNPAPAQHFNRAPAPAPHFNPAPAQHFNRAPAPAPHFNAPPQMNRAPAPAPHFNPPPQMNRAPAPQNRAPAPQQHAAPQPQHGGPPNEKH